MGSEVAAEVEGSAASEGEGVAEDEGGEAESGSSMVTAARASGCGNQKLVRIDKEAPIENLRELEAIDQRREWSGVDWDAIANCDVQWLLFIRTKGFNRA